MSGDKMDVEIAEQKMNSMEHSEQHYFKRYPRRDVGLPPRPVLSMLSVWTCPPSSSRLVRSSRSTASPTRSPFSRARWRRSSFPSPRLISSSPNGWDTSFSTSPCSTPFSTPVTPTLTRTVSSSPTRPPFSLPVSRMAITRRTRLSATALSEPLVDTVEVKAAVTEPTAVLTLDLYTCTTADLAFQSKFKLNATRDDFIHALVSWFDIDFTACHKPIRFSTGPHTKYTHWKQTVFYLEDVLTVQQGESVELDLDVRPNNKNRRDLDIKISYELETPDANRSAKGALEYRMC
uniref:WGS project CBMG000000000 data, contig CS5907-c001580 n=1 Tax=Fusarium acuminatum CS5907 TaxID=1318461 RepID=A0A096PFM3_9HYPO|nr:unnamed protein product [Fusarium acuminatum CS5907]